MKKNLAILLFSLFLTPFAEAQDLSSEKPAPEQFYIGFQPSIEVEPFDEYRNTADINLIPLVLEYAMNRRWSLRLSPLFNLQIRPELPSVISKVGAGITVPYHFSKKNDEEGHRGFYVGPGLTFTQNQADGISSATTFAEAGFAFLFNRVLSITVGVQAGSTLIFLPDSGYTRIAPHTGAIFSFGFWF